MSDINNIFKKVIDNSNIVDVVSHYLGSQALHKKGKSYVCLCPFHDDKHPSMSLDTNRNIFKCFSCGKGGGVIEFVSLYKNYSKIDSLKEIAKICNIDISELKDSSSNIQSVVDKFPSEINALKELSNYYSLILYTNQGKKGLEYLHSRGLDDEIIKEFNLGFAPLDNTSSINALLKKFDIPTLVKAGILSNSSLLSDKLFNRIIFPIKDNNGNIVSFSGRIIESNSNSAKYINYSDTQVFNKGNILYNFDKAINYAKQFNRIYIVEGYMDAIAYYRANIKEVVAIMGTALSERQINYLKNLKVEVRLSFDSDIAGKTNQLKVMKNLLLSGLKVMCVRPFKGFKDADEVIFKEGKDKLFNLSNNLLDPFLYMLLVRLNGYNKMNDNKLINSFIDESRYIYNLLDQVARSKDIKILEDITSIKYDDLINLYEKKKNNDGFKQKDNYYQNEYRKEKYKLKENKDIQNKIDKNFDPDIKTATTKKLKDLYDKEKMNNLSDIEYYFEIELIISCFSSIGICVFLDENKFIFHYSPFNELFMLIQHIYATNKKHYIDEDSFNKIYNILFNDNKAENQYEGIDLSDINSNYGHEIGSLEKRFLQENIESFKYFVCENEDKSNLDNIKIIHKKLIDIRKRKKT